MKPNTFLLTFLLFWALLFSVFSATVQGSDYEFSCAWYTDVHIDGNPAHTSAINSSFTYGESFNYTHSFLTGDTVVGWDACVFEEFWQSWQILGGNKYLLAGNHDIFRNGDVTNPVNYTFWEKYYSLPLNWTFSNQNYVFIGLSWDSLNGSAVKNWAYNIIDTNPDKHIIILTHSFFPHNETQLHSFLLARPNMEFVVLCGHRHIPTMQYFCVDNIQGILFDPQEIGYPNQTYFMSVDFYDDRIDFSIIDPIAEQPLGIGAPYECTITYPGPHMTEDLSFFAIMFVVVVIMGAHMIVNKRHFESKKGNSCNKTLMLICKK